MTFKGNNMTLDSAGEILMEAGGATVSIDKMGQIQLSSPTGIDLVCGASSLSILPGGIAIASPAVAAAAGSGGSKMSMGAEAVTMNSRTVTIESAGVCKIRGRKKLKLQESDKAKGKKKGAGGGGGAEEETNSGLGKRIQKGAVPSSTTLEIYVVDLKGEPQEALTFQINKPDGSVESGKLDKDGLGLAKSTEPGIFTVTFPNLDGADWDGDGAQPLPEQTRSEASKYQVQEGDRIPTIAKKEGFANWQTVWEFSKNDKLRSERVGPNLVQKGDSVSIPTKLKGAAMVQGGRAEYTVKVEKDDWVFNLWVRLDIDPNSPLEQEDEFLLTSTDGAVSIKKTVDDDQIPKDDNIELLFKDLDGEKSYSLKVKCSEDEYFLFEGVSGWDLHHMHDDEKTREDEESIEDEKNGEGDGPEKW